MNSTWERSVVIQRHDVIVGFVFVAVVQVKEKNELVDLTNAVKSFLTERGKPDEIATLSFPMGHPDNLTLAPSRGPRAISNGELHMAGDAFVTDNATDASFHSIFGVIFEKLVIELAVYRYVAGQLKSFLPTNATTLQFTRNVFELGRTSICCIRIVFSSLDRDLLSNKRIVLVACVALTRCRRFRPEGSLFVRSLLPSKDATNRSERLLNRNLRSAATHCLL